MTGVNIRMVVVQYLVMDIRRGLWLIGEKEQKSG